MTTPLLESLEERIAPAAISGSIITFSDADGDVVKITSSAGSVTATTDNMTHQLLSLDATNAAHSNITVSVIKKGATGDGFVNLGKLIANGVDLGNVKIAGDLGEITAGSGSTTIPAVASLTVRSFGELGLTSGADMNANHTAESDVNGSIKMLKIAGNMDGAFLDLTTGSLGSVTIGKSLIGESTANSGEILVTAGSIGMVKIGGSVQGGSASLAGAIVSHGGIAGITLGGSLVGGSQAQTGLIDNASSAPIGAVKIVGDLQGGAGGSSGSLLSNGSIASVTIGSSLMGGGGPQSGSIFMLKAGGTLGPVKIAHDMLGGFDSFAGAIGCSGALTSVTIGGSLIGNGSTNMDSGEIKSFGDMGAIKIAGSVVTGHTANSGSITSGGAIKSVTIGGFDEGGAGGNINAANDIGAIKIGSYLTAGIDSTNGGLGSLTIGGTLGGGNNVTIHGNIGSVTTGSINDSTFLKSTAGSILSVTVKGSVTGGSDISGATGLGTVKIAHDLSGGSSVGTTAGDIGKVTIGGDINNADIATGSGNIASVTIGGSVENSLIWGGVTVNNMTAIQIGTVKVGGDWVASSLSAGFSSGANFFFGDSDDVLKALSGNIASIVIGGQIIGTATAADHTGFDATSIGSFKIGSNTLKPASPSDTVFAQVTGGDVGIHIA